MPEVPPSSEDELHQGLSRRFPAGVFFLGVTRRFFVCGGRAGETESEALVGEGDGGGGAVFMAGPFPLPFPLPLAGVLRGSCSSSSWDSSTVMTVFLRCCSSDWDTFRCRTSFILLILSSRL